MAKKSTSSERKSSLDQEKSPGSDSSKIITISEHELYKLIEKRAYEMYLERGGHHGKHEDDWFKAEREIKSKMKKK
jgi:hypothetical protein